jgi:hypothetical protein
MIEYPIMLPLSVGGSLFKAGANGLQSCLEAGFSPALMCHSCKDLDKFQLGELFLSACLQKGFCRKTASDAVLGRTSRLGPPSLHASLKPCSRYAPENCRASLKCRVSPFEGIQLTPAFVNGNKQNRFRNLEVRVSRPYVQTKI